MNYAMIATGTATFAGRKLHMRWVVEHESRTVKHSELILRTETGNLVRRVPGRTFGLAQDRAVVFSAKAKEYENDLNPASLSRVSAHYLVAREDEYVDLLRIPHPVTCIGEFETIYYSPRAALQLRRLADQQRAATTSEAQKAQIRKEIDRITVDGSVRIRVHVTELITPANRG